MTSVQKPLEVKFLDLSFNQSMSSTVILASLLCLMAVFLLSELATKTSESVS